jgi:hypothetical protein
MARTGEEMVKLIASLLILTLGGCTLADRNAVAVGMCQRTAGCTVTTQPSTYGPPQVQAMENRKPVSKTTEK